MGSEVKISENTLFPLSLLWVLSSALIIAAVYFTTDHVTIASQGAEIKELKETQKNYQAALREFDHKLIRIMAHMNIPEDEKDDR